MAKPRLVVTDLDNTLLRRDSTISPYTADVFRRLRDHGILVAFATSRAARVAARFIQTVGPDIQITSCGAIAMFNGRQIYRAAIDIDTATTALSSIRTIPGVHQITVDSEHRYFASVSPIRPESGWYNYDYAETTDFSAPLPVADVFKIMVQSDEPGPIAEVVGGLPNLVMLTFTGETWRQITMRGASKEAALTAVCQRLGIPMSDVISFGDDHNDVPMLAKSGTSVAVANAIPECKGVSDHVCGDCDNDGVARWLEEYVLGPARQGSVASAVTKGLN